VGGRLEARGRLQNAPDPPPPFPGQAKRRPGIQGDEPAAPGSRISASLRPGKRRGRACGPWVPDRRCAALRLSGKGGEGEGLGSEGDVRESTLTRSPDALRQHEQPPGRSRRRRTRSAGPLGCPPGGVSLPRGRGISSSLEPRLAGRRGGGREARRGWAGQGSPAPQPPHGSIHGDTTPHSGSAPRLRSPETDTAIPAAAQRSARSGRGSGPSLVPPESGMHHHPCRRTVPPAAPAW
jgi:hypothetical protein